MLSVCFRTHRVWRCVSEERSHLRRLSRIEIARSANSDSAHTSEAGDSINAPAAEKNHEDVSGKTAVKGSSPGIRSSLDVGGDTTWLS